MSFVNEFKRNTNMTTTINGATCYSTTGNAILDMFGRIGGMRQATSAEIIQLYKLARAENVELADNMVLYCRDIRNGGIGERRIGRILLRELVKYDADKVCRNFDTIVNAGRWDDLYVFIGTPVEKQMFSFVKTQLTQDVKNMKAGKPISVLAKWLKSSNTSSDESRKIARKFYTAWGMTERLYRKTLSALRKYLDVVEVKMSAKDFDKIDYSKVPSVAMTTYRHAFGRQDYERFNAFIQSALEGKRKIHSGVSYPYELIAPYLNYHSGLDNTLEAQWKQLPDYVKEAHNVICMSDVSGSMSGQPMAISISLGIYFAEHNRGAYKNLMLTFTDKPRLFELNPNDSVYTRVKQVSRNVGYNTNLDGAFEAIYQMAKKTHESPEALVIISDGEIDSFARRHDVNSIVEKWQLAYEAIGLKAPKLIMWNCNSYGSHYLEKAQNENIAYISGASASTFKELTTLITMNAVEAMIQILTKPAFCWK